MEYRRHRQMCIRDSEYIVKILTDFVINTRDNNKHPVAGGPVDYDNEKNISEYPESRVSL